MSHLKGKHIFVTGATGLVGSHLVKRIAALEPASIVCLVRSRDPRSYFFLEQLDAQAVLVYGDLKHKERIIDIVSRYEIAHIFHIGAQPLVPVAYVNPYETFATNIMGTIHVLEAARMSPAVESVVVASSDKAYGKDCVDVTEESPLCGDHPYDVSKSSADLIAATYHATYGLPVTVSRFGNIFGPGDLNFNRIIPGMMKALLLNEALVLRSDGTFIRDYVFVDDVVSGYLALDAQVAKAKGQAFNFSSGYNYSVIDLINAVSDIVGKKISYSIANTQHNEIPAQSLNFDKAKTVLNWNPMSTFEQAIETTHDWYSRYLLG